MYRVPPISPRFFNDGIGDYFTSEFGPIRPFFVLICQNSRFNPGFPDQRGRGHVILPRFFPNLNPITAAFQTYYLDPGTVVFPFSIFTPRCRRHFSGLHSPIVFYSFPPGYFLLTANRQPPPPYPLSFIPAPLHLVTGRSPPIP